jgi:hypothetical protein
MLPLWLRAASIICSRSRDRTRDAPVIRGIARLLVMADLAYHQ